MKRFHDLPIRRKVTVAILMVFGLAVVIGGASVLIYQTLTYRARAVKELSAVAELVAVGINAPMRFDDHVETVRVLNRLRSRSEIIAAHVFRVSSLPSATNSTSQADSPRELQLFVSSPTNAAPPAFLRQLPDGVWFEAGRLWLVRDLTDDNGNVFAQLALHSNLQGLRQDRIRSLQLLGLVMLGLLGLSLGLLANFLKRSLTQPISLLASTVHAITEKKDHRLRAPKIAGDELGSLAEDFNRMLSSLEQQAAVLRENEERYRLLVENSSELVCEMSSDWRYLYACPNYKTTLGYEPAALIGTKPFEFVHPEDLPSLRSKMKESADGALGPVAFRLAHKDGSWRWLEASGRRFTVSSGESRMVIVARDITARIESEQEKAKLETQLRQSQKMEAIGTLAGGIAHDFNNILAAIIPYTQMAIDDLADKPDARENLAEVLKAADRAKHLVQQILAFSRRQQHQRSSVRLQPLIKEALKLLRSALPTTIEIVSQLDSDAPPVLADPSQIHQVMMNLCTNASHAMKGQQGKLEVRLAPVTVDGELVLTCPDLRPGPHVCLTVTDNGHGMDAETIKRIFDPFFTTKAPGEGTGLGLSVVHGIVKAHEGAIHVSSRIGEGTAFQIYFPASAEAVELGAPSQASLPQGQGQRILYIDDEPSICFLAEKMLARLGYKVTTFSDPRKALENFRSQPQAFDVVLTDLTMPGLTGLNVASEVLKIQPKIPVLLASGFAGYSTATDFQQAGIREVLPKPISLSLYAEALQRALTLRKDESP